MCPFSASKLHLLTRNIFIDVTNCCLYTLSATLYVKVFPLAMTEGLSLCNYSMRSFPKDYLKCPLFYSPTANWNAPPPPPPKKKEKEKRGGGNYGGRKQVEA